MNLLTIGVNLLLTVVTPLSAEEFELNGIECGLSGNPRLIVNGNAAAPGQFPWMVHVRGIIAPNTVFGCGGTIITKRHVLTAAHCVAMKGKKPLKVQVLYGDVHLNKAKKLDVESKMVHQLYSKKPPVNDIAILLVKGQFQFSDTVKPACLPPVTMDVVRRRVLAPGWGATSPGGPPANKLQYATLKVVPDIVCRILYRGSFKPGKMLCTHNRRSSVCEGDSGGPLFAKVSADRFVQVGITSFGTKFCRLLPNVFTRVDAFMPWIKKNIGNYKAYEKISTSYVSPVDSPVPSMEPYTFLPESEEYDISVPYYFPW